MRSAADGMTSLIRTKGIDGSDVHDVLKKHKAAIVNLTMEGIVLRS
jgi:hypothetical protein